MTQPDDEFGEFVRLSLHAAAASIVVGPEGLDRIRAQLAAKRTPRAVARREHAGLAVPAGRLQPWWADWTPEHS
jgi:hypothetical protein